MQNLDDFTGECIVAYSVDANGHCNDDVLVLEIDRYDPGDDKFVNYKGRQYNWEVEVYSLISLKTGTLEHLGEFRFNILSMARNTF